MAQEIVRLCDPCLAEDASRVGGVGLTVNLGDGPLVVDLCDSHLARLVKPLADVLGLYGVAEGRAARTRKGGTGRRRQPRATPAEGAAEVAEGGRAYPCPWCDYESAASSPFRRHVAEVHGLAGFSSWAGRVCPVCGEDHPPRGTNSMAAHVRDAHGLPSVARAVRAGRDAGDPYGIDAALQTAVNA